MPLSAGAYFGYVVFVATPGGRNGDLHLQMGILAGVLGGLAWTWARRELVVRRRVDVAGDEAPWGR